MSDIDHTPAGPQSPPALPPLHDELLVARPAATTVGEEEEQAAGDALALDQAVADAPADSPAVHADDARATTVRLYALVALAYAQRLAAIEETQQQQAAALATVRAHLAQLDARQVVRLIGEAPQHAALAAYQDAQEDSAEREGVQERRVADRRVQQDRDRERFEEAVMAQYVPPPSATAALAAIPRPDERAPHPAAIVEEGAGDAHPVDAPQPVTRTTRPPGSAGEERHAGQEAHRSHPSVLARILAYLRSDGPA